MSKPSKLKLKKFYSDEEQVAIMDLYDAHYKQLVKTFEPDYSVLTLEIMAGPDGVHYAVIYWTNFYPCVMPQADYVMLTIENPKNEEGFDFYTISQKELLKVLGKNVSVVEDPMTLYVIDTKDSKKLHKAILDASGTY